MNSSLYIRFISASVSISMILNLIKHTVFHNRQDRKLYTLKNIQQKITHRFA